MRKPSVIRALTLLVSLGSVLASGEIVWPK